ncbi:exonuclease 3'-5' domain-containing protein 2 [Orussus abietinus]|uniref:exonuclease 3'-5' domain-containing protein 2 n=1 Tax=Orussus abietinus TaxID=222816 RepID=UPI000626BD6B|nr:exonuclease 3'-5' domain-containing protein 2 [Orussus abietinus]
MFFVCVTVGLVLLASKYRNNVLRSVKRLCHGITNHNSNSTSKTNNNTKLHVTLDKIILADSLEKCDYAVQRIHCNLSNGILGFDCEWVNEGPVSLLQLATYNGVCALFRLGKIGYIPTKLKELLANRRVLKVGVASFEDGKKLTNDYGCCIFGTLDLRSLAKSLGLPSPKSLAALCFEYLGIEMNKATEVRCSDWNADNLTNEQIVYAAYDAVASVLIYHQIRQQAKVKYSLWKNLILYLKRIWNADADEKFHGLPQGVIDTRFKVQQFNTTINKEISPEEIKINNKPHKNSIPARNKPLYHNCYLEAPDGEVLCTCDRKKAEWYIAKGLGTIIQEDPLTVRLTFEPSGRALGEVGKYYTQVKVNQCVVCGSSDKFIKKNVVPKEYRKYFPEIMKSHQSHDILLLCPECHEISNLHDLQLRKKLAVMCGAPLFETLPHQWHKTSSDWRKLYSAVKALKNQNSLPAKRRPQIESVIVKCTGQKVTADLLDVLERQLKNGPMHPPLPSSYMPHGQAVVYHFQNNKGGLIELERLWREHFVRSMKPQYLPKLWSVSHSHQRFAIRQMQNRIKPEDAKLVGLIK